MAHPPKNQICLLNLRTVCTIFAHAYYMKKEMDRSSTLLEEVTKGIQEKKGENIVIADLNNIEDRICSYFVICQGNSPQQVEAIVDSVADFAREHAARKPYMVDGLQNSQWVIMDYGDVLVHVFLPEEREYYDLEHLWADARLTRIPDAQ